MEFVGTKKWFSLAKICKTYPFLIIWGIYFILGWFYPAKSLPLVIITLFFLIDLSIRWRKSQSIVLLFMFMASHIVMFIPFFLWGLSISFYEEYQDIFYFARVLSSLSVFVFVIWLFAKPPKNKEISFNLLAGNLNRVPNLALFVISVSIMVFIIATGIQGETIFSAGGYSKVSKSTFWGLKIFEYFLIFFLLAFISSNGARLEKIILISLAVAYISKNLLYGGRIESLQLLLMVFILFFEGKWRNKKVLALLSIVVFVFVIWGNYRGNVGKGFLEILKVQTLNPYSILSTQSEIIYSSAVIQSLRIDSVLSDTELFQMFVFYLLSVFIPSRFMPSKTYLTEVARDTAQFGGGGLISSYFYAWLGFVGVVAIGLLVSWLLLSVCRKKSQALTVYQIMILCTFPRWFSYSPITMFKLCLYAVVAWYVYEVVLRALFKR